MTDEEFFNKPTPAEEMREKEKKKEQPSLWSKIQSWCPFTKK